MIVRTKKAVLRLGFAAPAFVAIALAANLGHAAPLAIGTIEKVDSKKSSVTILGQQYSIGSASLLAGSKSLPASKGVPFLAPGALVWVDGEFRADGSVQVSTLTVLPEANIPGSTQLFVAGVVKAVSVTGKVMIGNLTVDITPTLSGNSKAIRVGDAIEILGVQSATNDVLVASALAPLRAQGVGGTGKVAGVGGTGFAGVGGTGQLAGVGGTGKVAGVGGTGFAGVGGTGQLAGVGGTGKLAGVGGTGKLAGVGGTGKVAGVGGTGFAGVGGTGQLAGVGGTGKLAGVGGTGFAGVGGTGQLAGVGGTGKLAGVGGTGKLAGVGGTGFAGVGGTGQLAGVGGTGKVAGVGGTGKLAGVGGTGKLAGVGGTGGK